MAGETQGYGAVEAVVFDLDGTLVDTLVAAPTAYVETVRALGGPELSIAEVVGIWHIGPTPVVLSHFLRRPVTPGDLECFTARFADAVAEVRPFPGVPGMIDALLATERRLGIYTTATLWAARLMLSNTGLLGAFEVVVGGDEVEASKPHPAGLELACERLSVRPGAAAYVGDADADLLCARACGAVAIHAAWGGGPRGADMEFAVVAEHPDRVPALVAASGPS